MSLFSFFRKNKQEDASAEREFLSRAEDESSTARSRAKRKSKSSDAGVDPVLPEKKRARRRLIGAIALVLAAVIGLPMILDSEPKPLAEDIAIQIPSKDQQSPARKSRSLARPEAALDGNEELIDPPESPTTTAPAPLSSASETADKEGAKAVSGSKVTVTTVASTSVTTGAKTDTVVPKRPISDVKDDAANNHLPIASDTREAARAKAILEGKPEIKAEPKKSPVEGKSTKYLLQVAALSNQEKINELRTKLKAAGIPSSTQKVATASGERTRIRVGPFASKEEAEKARTKLAKLGLNGTLVPIGN